MKADSRARNVVAALSDPLRRRILERLTLAPATAAELATALDAPVEQVRYQIKRLRATGFVVVQGERARRGAVERTFIADSRKLVLSADDLSGTPAHRLRDQEIETLTSTFVDAVEAARTGALSNDDRHFLVHIPMLVDAEGFREIGEQFEAAMARLLRLREECLARLEEGGEKSRPATLGLFFYELPD